MFDSKGFDSWADSYDKDMERLTAENSYPFAGYREVLGRIARTILEKDGVEVLELGFGTGTLASELYEKGCEIYGQDYSGRMVELAQAKMPGAHLYQKDFGEGLAEPLLERKYDFIVATYAMHHLTDEQKISLINDMIALLKDDGKILIGDISFETREDMNRCREEYTDEWDDDEIYFVAEEFKKVFPEMEFEKISFCGGVISIPKKTERRTGNMKLSAIFEEKPERWGFRGDPYFWDHLKERAENMDILSPDELEQWIKEEYLSLSGKPLTDEYMDFAVIKQFAHGGMSSGGVDNRWWMRKGIPLLKSRLGSLR